MYTLEGVSSVETSLQLMKSLNKTETSIFLSVVCRSFVSKGNLFDVCFIQSKAGNIAFFEGKF